MKSIGKCLSSALFCSVALLGLTAFSASADSNNVNGSRQQSARVTAVQPSQNHAEANQPNGAGVNNYYNRKQRGVSRIYQPHYGFMNNLNNHRGKYTKGWYDKRIKYTRVATTPKGTFVKTHHGWLNKNAFNQFVITHGPLHYRMQVIHNGNLYNRPAKTTGAYKINSTANLNLLHRWVNVDASADTNVIKGFYHFKYNHQGYWIPGQDLMFNLRALKGHNHRIERVIKTGERMINHSPYDYNTTRRLYDCSNFIHHIFAVNGRYISSSIYYQAQSGEHVNFHHMRRGDIFFFAAKGQGYLAHVAIYLGHGLFMHDSPSSDNGGVDVSSLHDKVWHCFNHYRTVYPNKIARRIL